MRQLVLIPLFLFSFWFEGLTQALTFSNDIVLNVSDVGLSRPKVALAGNTPVVIWGKRWNENVYCSRIENNQFTTPIQVNPIGVNVYAQDWTGPDLAAINDTVYVAFKTQPDDLGHICLARSIDGGLSFSDTLRISNNSLARFPEVSVSKNGNPSVAFMKFEANWHEQQYVVTHSINGGETFNASISSIIGTGDEACDCCPAHLLNFDKGYVLLYRNNDNNLRNIWAGWLNDLQDTSMNTTEVDTTNWIINGCPSSGPHGVVYKDSLLSIWMSGANGNSQLYLSTMSKNELKVSNHQNFSLNTVFEGNQNFPKVVANGDTIGVVYQENKFGNVDIKFAHSTTGVGGLLKSVPITLNDHTESTQKNPDIHFEKGKFHFVWQDEKLGSVVYKSASFGLSSRKTEFSPNNIKIFPNPNNGSITIDLNDFENFSNPHIEFYSISNQLIMKKEINLLKNTVQANLPRGVYLLRFVSGEVVYINRLIVDL